MSNSRKKIGKYFQRRELLKLGLGSSALAILPSCIHMDRWIIGNDIPNKADVVVVGAGLAGLALASKLKREGINFRLFEASERPGGRIWTLDDFNSAGHSVDLGGEWIDREHAALFRLCKDMRVEVEDFSAIGQFDQVIVNGRFSPLVQQQKSRMELQKWSTSQLKKWDEGDWDQRSFRDVLEQLKNQIDPQVLLNWQRQAEWEWGVDPNDLSALIWLQRSLRSGDPSSFSRQQKWRIRGGSQVLINALYSRVSGVIPQKFVSFSHKWVGVREKTDSFELVMETPNGEQIIEAKVVVSALPLPCLRDVDGFSKLGFPDEFRGAIQELQFGQHAKIALAISEKFWDQSTNVSRWFHDKSSNWYWDRGVRKGTSSASKTILVSQTIGSQTLALGPAAITEIKNQFNNLKGFRELRIEREHFQPWHQNQFAHGSKLSFRPGQGILYGNLLSQIESQGRFHFIGDSFAKNPGSMNGAVETANQVFDLIMSKRPTG